MKVVQFPNPNLTDIAAGLRRLAEWVDTLPKQDLSCIIIFGMNTQEVNVYGFGQRTSGLETQGWIARAAAEVSNSVRRVATDDSSGPAA